MPTFRQDWQQVCAGVSRMKRTRRRMRRRKRWIRGRGVGRGGRGGVGRRGRGGVGRRG